MNISGTCEFSRAQEGSLSSVVERASKSVMLHVPRCAAALPQPLPRPTAAACGRPHLPSAHADLCPPPPITIAGVAAKVPSAPVTWAPGYGEHPAHTVRSLPHAWSTALYLAPRPAFFTPERLSPEPFPQLMSTARAAHLGQPRRIVYSCGSISAAAAEAAAAAADAPSQQPESLASRC